MNHRAAGEIDSLDASIGIERTAHESVNGPNHVGEREVNDKHPDRCEEKHCGEFHTFRSGSEDERRCDDRESQLEHCPDVVGDPVVARADIAWKHPVETGLRQVADEGVATGESEAVSTQEPENRYQSSDPKRHSQNRKHVLRAHQAAIEEGQAGQCHEEHQSRAHHLPGIMTGAGAGDLGCHIRRACRIVDIGLEIGDPLLHGRISRCCGFRRSSSGFANDGGCGRVFNDGCGSILSKRRREGERPCRENRSCKVCQCFMFYKHGCVELLNVFGC